MRAVLGLMIGGIPAVFLAYTVFSGLNLNVVKGLVVVVVLYTAYGLLKSAFSDSEEEIIMNPALDA
jgi:hypothetical protein